jgi:glutamyl-tRNA reductase
VRFRDSSFDHLGYFSVIGTNFTKADTLVRSNFAISHDSLEEFYLKVMKLGIRDAYVISTCNRTEFYACAPEGMLRDLVSSQLNVTERDFQEYFYTHNGVAAIRHFFNVTVGLDSQIIGDYEIAGQVKKAVQFSRECGMIGTLADRVSSLAFQASKEVKAKTNLSSGKYSVSYAAAELISTQTSGIEPKKILIVGTGEIGKAMARNLREYFPACELTVTNRTLVHAQQVSEQVNARILPFESFTDHLHSFDAVIAAAQSSQYLIQQDHVRGLSTSLFLDLSIPQVIDPAVKNQEGIQLFSVDEISSLHHELIRQRHLEVPKAQAVVEEFVHRLMEWQNVFSHRDIIQSYRRRMEKFLPLQGQSKKIDNKFSHLIRKIRVEGYRGCAVIQTMNELIAEP